MAVHSFVMWPDARLQTVCAPVERITDEIRSIWDEMVEKMEAMPGVGLAGPQIGVMQQLAVVDASQDRGQAIRMANPKILFASEKPRDHDEASPNLPGLSARVTRPRAVTVEFLNAKGETETQDFVGLWSTSVQHQIDHLAGKMYFDRLSRTKRQMLLKKAAKLRAQR